MGNSNDPSRRSGEWSAGMLEMAKAVALDASETAVHRALASKAADDGRRDAILDQLVTEMRGLRSDLKPVLENQVRHATVLEDHTRQLESLWEKKDKESDKIKTTIEETAKQVMDRELANVQKQSRMNWAGMWPAAVGTVIATVIGALLMHYVTPHEKSDTKPDQTATKQP